jgi:peptide methionine sulfoxide reductase msrA/msrB
MRPTICYLLLLSACGFPTKESAFASEESALSDNYDRNAWNQLSPEQAQVIERAGTESPGTGQFLNHHESGVYTCARCRAPLFASDTKFESGCGWPSFDDSLPGAVKEIADPDGRRVEIRCARCDGHLGHVFRGEGLTDKNTRHCVNSVSMDFASGVVEQAFFAGGCFWGVEHLLAELEGVLDVDSGFMGGHVDRPTYREVVSGRTGHAETVRVAFDPRKVSFETLAKLFFEIHDPTQMNRQGPDVGSQYRSAVYFANPAQQLVTEKLIGLLKGKGLNVVTEVSPAGFYWPAEDYHQDYYANNGKQPYCHMRVERF